MKPRLYEAIAQEKGYWEFCTAAVGLCWMQDVSVHDAIIAP